VFQEDLISLSQLCPNLQILFFQFPRGELNLVNPLLEPLFFNLRSLRALEIHCPSATLTLPTSSQTLPLEVLVLDTPRTHSSGTNLTKVHTLYVYNGRKSVEPTDLHKWTLPALRRLTLGMHFRRHEWRPVFDAYGSQITSLDLGLSMRVPILDVLNRCTSLEELTITCLSITEFDDEIRTTKLPLKRVLLYFFSGGPLSIHVGRAVDEFNRCMKILLQTDTPRLQFLHFLDLDSHSFQLNLDWRSSHMAGIALRMEQWTERGVRFEGRSGDLIRLPVRDSWVPDSESAGIAISDDDEL
jgi:hypothetical protein